MENGISFTIKKYKQDLTKMIREPLVLVIVIVIFLLLIVFIIYPIFEAGRYSLYPVTETGAERTFGFGAYEYIFSHQRYFNAILNSMLLGAIVATLATTIGFIFAYATIRIKIPGHRVFRNLALLPIISPPFMFSLSLILLFGRVGLITSGVFGIDMFNIYGLGGLITVQTIGLFPLSYMTLTGILQAIDPDLETCAMNLGATPFKTFTSVTLPLTMPGIFASWLLVFVGSLTDFGNPIVLGGDFDVLSVQAYMEFTGMGNLPRGCGLAIILIIPTVAIFFLQKYILRKKSYTTITGKSTRRTSAKANPLVKTLSFIFCSFISLFVIMLYATIIVCAFVRLWGFDWTPTIHWFIYAFEVGLETLQKTVTLAAVATPVTALLGMIVAFLVVRKAFPGKHVLEFLTMMSYAIPGTAVGIGYILAFNKPPLLLTGGAFILIACYVFRNLPIGVESGVAALKQISSDIEESSTNLGANSTYTFRRITLPLITPSFFAGATFSFVRSMTAISAIIFLVSGSWQHLTVLTLAQMENMRIGAAAVFSTILIVIVMISLLIIKKITKLGQEKVFGQLGQ